MDQLTEDEIGTVVNVVNVTVPSSLIGYANRFGVGIFPSLTVFTPFWGPDRTPRMHAMLQEQADMVRRIDLAPRTQLLPSPVAYTWAGPGSLGDDPQVEGIISGFGSLSSFDFRFYDTDFPSQMRDRINLPPDYYPKVYLTIGNDAPDGFYLRIQAPPRGPGELLGYVEARSSGRSNSLSIVPGLRDRLALSRSRLAFVCGCLYKLREVRSASLRVYKQRLFEPVLTYLLRRLEETGL